MNFIKYFLLLSLLFPIGCTAEKSSNKLKISHTQKAAGKSRGPFRVEFSSIKNSDGDLTITATVDAKMSIDLCDVKWTLPENWQILDGDLELQHDFSKDKSLVKTITVKGDKVLGNDQAFLFVSKMQNGERFGVSASYIYKDEEQQIKAKELSEKLNNSKKVKFIE